MKKADEEGLKSLTGLGDTAKPEQITTASLQFPAQVRAKAQMDARRGVLFKLMVTNPEFQQKLINMQVGLHQATGVPLSPRYDQGEATQALKGQDGPDLSDDDYLSQLQTAQGKGQ